MMIKRPLPSPVDNGNIDAEAKGRRLSIDAQERARNCVYINPDIIEGFYAAQDGLVLVNEDFKEYIIPMSYQSALENVDFLQYELECIAIDKRELVQ